MNRIVLKLSGEALAVKDQKGDIKEIFDPEFVNRVAIAVKKCVDAGNQIALVVGAGNIWRGRAAEDMNRTEADRMGMLATVINAIRLKDALIRQGAPAVVMTSVAMPPFAEPYSSQAAIEALEQGKIVVFGAGLGIPFLSTDTTVAVRAAEIGADAILMAKSVDYIYDDDPRKNPDAKPIKEIKASEVLAKNLKAIDATATAFCLSTGMTVKLFGLNSPDDIISAVVDGKYGTVITAD